MQYWSDGLQQLTNPSYQGYVRKTPKTRSGWANLDQNAKYDHEHGQRGPWCWCPPGAADVLTGGGMPGMGWHVSVFAVWRAERRQALTDLGERHESVGDARSIGLFGVIELVKNRQTKEPLAPFNGSSPEMLAVRKYCLDHGLYLYTHWHTVLVIPPLIISEEQLAEGFAALDRALRITDEAANGK